MGEGEVTLPLKIRLSCYFPDGNLHRPQDRSIARISVIYPRPFRWPRKRKDTSQCPCILFSFRIWLTRSSITIRKIYSPIRGYIDLFCEISRKELPSFVKRSSNRPIDVSKLQNLKFPLRRVQTFERLNFFCNIF